MIVALLGALTVEPEYGRTARLECSDPPIRLVHTNDVGRNSGAAAQGANNKGCPNFFLQTFGHNLPAGRVFVRPWYIEMIRDSLRNRGFTDIRTVQAFVAIVMPDLPIRGSNGGSATTQETQCNEQQLPKTQLALQVRTVARGTVLLLRAKLHQS